MDIGILIAYFAKQDEARKALSELARQGFTRTVLIRKATDGVIRVTDPFRKRQTLALFLAAFVSGGMGWLAVLLPHRSIVPQPLALSSFLIVMALFFGFGIVATLFWFKRRRYGVETGIIRDHSRWLVSGESVLILQTPIEFLQAPMALLRESGDIPPVLFAIHCRPDRRINSRTSSPNLSQAQILEHAERHAREQQLEPTPRHSSELLNRLRQSRHLLRQVCTDLSVASSLEQKATPAADWILDNQYILEGNARDVLLNLPRRFYRQLPTLASNPYQGLPCIYGLAKDLVTHNQLRLDQENILAYIGAYQAVRSLSIGELWAIPQMLRIALIESVQGLAVTTLSDLHERQLADFWANRLIAANRRDANQLFTILAELAAAEPSPSPYFGTQLVGLLHDEVAALSAVQSWLERSLKKSLHDFNLTEQNRQTMEQLACGNAFTSLRRLALLNWREIFEQLSRVEQLLRRDPAGIYPGMDFATRDRNRRTVEELARRAGLDEEAVAKQVLNLASQSRQQADDNKLANHVGVTDHGACLKRLKDHGISGHRVPQVAAGGTAMRTFVREPDRPPQDVVPCDCLHVGTWLVGAGRAELARLLGCRESLRYRLLAWSIRRHPAAYFTVIGVFTGLLFLAIARFISAEIAVGLRLGLLLLLLIPVSQLAIELANYLITRLLPPHPLPKMNFEDSGIPDAFLTLVVVPIMLVNQESIRAEVEKLSIRFLANKEKNLLFGLFTDYTDATSLHREDDGLLFETARICLAELNQSQGSDRFFLFHRERIWSESEQKFIGWERKRGKLEELNRLIDGSRPETAPSLVFVGNPDRLADVRFVITLDSDTQLPHPSARRLIETMAHPLNQPRFDGAGRIVAGYTIIQPRVSPTLPSTSASIFSRLFADAVGIDPYTQAVSDVYHDLSGEGSYHGKGIYDVRAFSRLLSGRFPEDRILSHDLIEGAHVRVGLASDIELYDEFPQGYQSYSSRAHRWIRGDWQIIDWIFSRVPQAAGGFGQNPLSLFNRWKILDNLRRSLLPAASVALLLTAWFLSPQTGGIASLVIGMQLLFHPLAQPFTMATTHKGLKYFSPAKLGHDLLRAASDAALLPHQAAVSLDAIGRVCYRRLISRRNLLEWQTQTNHRRSSHRQHLFVTSLAMGSIFSLLLTIAIRQTNPAILPQAAPWLILWFFSPLLGWLLNLRPTALRQSRTLKESDRRFLRQVGRRTWRYFASFVNPDSSWLPPDNYQVAHQNRLAMRTSPTNIGLWMTSALAAHDSGYLTINQLVEKLGGTMASIDQLERHRGHLLNWYDIKTLLPLEPRYVSTVDSGNLLGALWSLEQGLDELRYAPLLDGKAFRGLADTGEIVRQNQAPVEMSRPQRRVLDQVLSNWHTPPIEIIALLDLQRRTEADLNAGLAAVSDLPWLTELDQQRAAWRQNSDRYLCWLEILSEQTEDALSSLGQAAILAIKQALIQAPSLFALAHGEIEAIRLLTVIHQKSPDDLQLGPWLARLLAAFASARWLAGESLAELEALLGKIRDLSAGMGMGFLYDPKRKLFAIGYNLSTDRQDISSYDLLASEARLGSFIAIARGDVPLEHWFSLGRPYGAIGRQRVLLSWTGTMFEYLMPLLFQYSYRNSLLDKAAREAVRAQIDYGRSRSVPWGISESGFADLDQENTFQYKAFGVPVLGLKRGLEEQLVIAPYATLLALDLAPSETVANLKRLADLGMLGDYGYYEAMDFSRQAQREPQRRPLKRGVIVEAYMAHHQGMAFLSLSNFLNGKLFPRRFHRDPRVRAFEALLQERIPTLPPLQLLSTRQPVPLLLAADLIAPARITFNTPHTSSPRSLLLSNSSYDLMVTNSGGGYSQWNGQELTRWRSDQTRDAHGSFCYIHEADDDRLWSNTWQPVGGKTEEYSVDFSLERAVFRRVDNGIHTETELIVSPEDDLELRRITLVNRSSRSRHLKLTSYIELSMAPHNADRQHPAFNKLFIETEAIPELEVLLASHRPRSDNEAPLFVGHCFCLNRPGDDNFPRQDFQFETDRGRFIGRGQTLAHPMGARQDLGNSQGFVLDPALILRQAISLDPGQGVQLVMILAAGASREQVLHLLEKYKAPHATERAMEFAWRSTQQQLQVLHIQPDEARRFQQLAGHVLFPNQLLRAPARLLADNRKGQAGLWPYAISGDLPLVLLCIGEARDIGLVRQMLQAHTYWRMQGLSTDLLILNEEAGSYDRPLEERLERLILAHGHALSSASKRPGNIFLKNAAQIPAEDCRLFKAAATVVLVAARGTLPQQLSVTTEGPELQVKVAKKRPIKEASAPLSFMELHYFNSLGGFSRDGHEYAIYLGPGTNTPAPWVNVIANPNFGSMVSETGSGFTWYGNSQRNRLTGWSNDPVLDPPSEALYLRDEESGVFWSPTALPIREKTAYRARHGAGYTVFEHNSHGIEQELTVFVPVDANGGAPVKLQRLRLLNTSTRKRRLSITYYVELTLGENRESSQMHVITNWDDESQALLAQNHYHPEYPERVAFVAISPQADSYGGDRAAFIGRNRSLADPAAMELTSLSQRTGAGLDPCAALRVSLALAPGERTEISCILGQAGSVAEARQLICRYQEDLALDQALEETKAWWDSQLGCIEVHTPELAADLLINRWLQYQALSCRIWARSAFYQSGGAFGFRDQLQDVLAFLYTSPDLARRQILLAASRQFTEGDVQHWWHEPTGAGIRSRISDDLLWLPYVVGQYVRATGDLEILKAEIPFLKAPQLADDQHEQFSTPEAGFERASLFDHCRRAVSRGLTIGPHGLPLIGTGDWNDGMNLVGAEGKGESVWLAWFLCELLTGMADLAEQLQQTELGQSYRQERLALIKRVEKAGWDGEWYLRGTFDDGSPLGSAENLEARIDSLPQSWAKLSGAADPYRCAQALESAWQHLVCRDEGLVLLFTPPFSQSKPSPGYIKGYPPGVRENGGQYTHAALWLAMAIARQGDGERAVALLRMLNPIEHARDATAVWHYGVEPYVVAADVYRLPGRIGQGGWSWYTGSAAWMYRAWVEEVLGLRIENGLMRIEPVIPAAWPGFSLRYRHSEAIYEIEVENPQSSEPGLAWVEMDGRRMADGVIPLEEGLVRHRVLVRLVRRT